MRPPTARPGVNRAQTSTPTLSGRVSPADSVASSKSRTPKRKAGNDLEDGAEETNINVVVRCRGRNDREVRENSGVVVSTDGVKGKKVDLSMGPNALSNKSYQFDKVFSPAADQGMVFEEVVAPILDEVSRVTDETETVTDGCRSLPASTVLSLPMARRAPERHTRCLVTSPRRCPFPTQLE